MSFSRTLSRRLLLVGLAQLALMTIVFMGVGWVVNGPPPEMGGHDAPHGPPPGPPPEPHTHVSPLDTLFVAGLVILGGGSLLTARGIVSPLRELSRAANALGAGDLRARSAIARDDEIGDLSRSFDAMASRVESLVLAQKELLANVSHELRTPLARIRVAMDIAGEGDDEAQRHSLTEIGVDLAELETLIDDILTTTRLDIARGTSSEKIFELHLEDVDVRALCAEAMDRFRARHPSRRVDLGEMTNASVRVDRALFRRVLDNLLENAHKYSRDATAVITLRASSRDGAVEFEIEDHGIGIAEADLPHVFTPFFRGERSRARGAGGVGLGLTLAKRIVEAHGGTIAVDSRMDVGTTVRVHVSECVAREDDAASDATKET
jgi:signal transduction histidine kinase